jgi:hypothetical protein
MIKQFMALFYACQNHKYEIIEELLKWDADINLTFQYKSKTLFQVIDVFTKQFIVNYLKAKKLCMLLELNSDIYDFYIQ